MSVTTTLSASLSSLVLSYLELRKTVGIIGVALPFVLVFGQMILPGPAVVLQQRVPGGGAW